MPELTILKLLLSHTNWINTNQLGAEELPKEIQGIYRTLQQHHLNNDSDLSLDDLSNLYFSTNPRDRDYAIGIFDQLGKIDASVETTETLIRGIRTKKLLRELSLAAYEAVEGRGSMAKVSQIQSAIDELAAKPTSEDTDNGVSDGDFVTNDLEKLVADTVKKVGLRWRLQTLNYMLGSLRKGDFGFIFARPETGKTTFLASEVSFMAGQLTDEDGPILWLNNEEQGNKVVLRAAQAFLNLSMTDLFRDVQKANKDFNDGVKNKFLLHDNPSLTKRRVEALCQKYKPSLILIDQIDKVQGFESDREDLRLGAIYQWARELAKTYGPVIAVCQADGTGEGQRWLTMAHVANAKTSKQAEADWILGIGKVHDPGYDNIRYLHASKNKLMGDSDSKPELRHGRVEVLIDPEHARYVDIMT